MQDLPLTSEATIFYLRSCKGQSGYVNAQQNKGVEPPKIKLNDIYNYRYRKNNGLTGRDMSSILEELTKIRVLDED